MSNADLSRLTRDLAADADLRARLAPALAPGADPATAIALLHYQGYAIDAAELPRLVGPRRLDQLELNRVAGGQMTTKNFTSPFEPD